jgi:ferredoxin
MNRRIFTVGSLIPGAEVVVTREPQMTVTKALENTPPPQTKAKTIVVMQNQNRFEVKPEKGILLEIALKQGQHIQYKCQKGTCGQCKVKVMDGVFLSSPTVQEQKKLGEELNEGYRLACQAVVNI